MNRAEALVRGHVPANETRRRFFLNWPRDPEKTRRSLSGDRRFDLRPGNRLRVGGKAALAADYSGQIWTPSERASADKRERATCLGEYFRAHSLGPDPAYNARTI